MALLKEYLQDQVNAVEKMNISNMHKLDENIADTGSAAAPNASHALVPVGQSQAVGGGAVKVVDVPSADVLEEFKVRVRSWMEVDNNLKKLQAVKKEQMNLKKELTKQVLEFMAKYNIEDLNTKDGKLRYKVTNAKAPVTRTTIRTRVMEMYGKAATVQEMIEYVFSTDQTVEKPSLRRLKNTRETRLD